MRDTIDKSGNFATFWKISEYFETSEISGSGNIDPSYSRYLVVECKGFDRWSDDDSKEKRNTGDVGEEKSNG